MGITVKKIDTEKTCVTNMIHTILNLTKQGDCVTCTSVEQYLYKEAHYYTSLAEVSTVLKILSEMGYFTVEYGKTKCRPNNVKKIYTRTNKSNNVF